MHQVISYTSICQREMTVEKGGMELVQAIIFARSYLFTAQSDGDVSGYNHTVQLGLASSLGVVLDHQIPVGTIFMAFCLDPLCHRQ
jgi:hypothetical protein